MCVHICVDELVSVCVFVVLISFYQLSVCFCQTGLFISDWVFQEAVTVCHGQAAAINNRLIAKPKLVDVPRLISKILMHQTCQSVGVDDEKPEQLQRPKSVAIVR